MVEAVSEVAVVEADDVNKAHLVIALMQNILTICKVNVPICILDVVSYTCALYILAVVDDKARVNPFVHTVFCI